MCVGWNRGANSEEAALADAEEIERLRDVVFHFAARHDCVEETVLQEKLRGLESLWKLLADGLLDDARTREADLRAWLCDVQVTEHREARTHSARGRISHDADVWHTRIVEFHQRGADLRHLHQADGAFLHTCS